MTKIIFTITSLFVTAAQAYILPPSYFFVNWATKNKEQQNIVIRQERDTISQNTVTQTAPELIKIKRPGLYKWTSDVPGFEVMKVLSKTKATTGTPQVQRAVPIQSVLTPIEVASLYVQGGNIEAMLSKQLKVDVSQTKLELIQKTKEIRVGDPKGNRLYISPDTELLDAMIFDEKLYIFKYKPEKFYSYPSEIEIYENGVLKERVRTKSFLTNAKIADSEFEVK